MSKETKFGYGFLLAGVGLPYLIEKLAGPLVALVIAVACAVLGVSFLLAGHLHRDREIESQENITLAAKSIKYGALVLIIFGLVAGISRLGWMLVKKREGNITASTEQGSPRDIPHIQATVMIDSVTGKQLGFHCQLENIGEATVNIIRISSQTDKFADVQTDPDYRRTLPPHGKLSVPGLPHAFPPNVWSNLLMTVQYNAEVDQVVRSFISTYRFLVLADKPKLIQPDSWAEAEGSIGEQQQIADVLSKISSPVGTMYMVIYEVVGGTPNLVRFQEKQKSFLFDPIAGVVHFRVVTNSGRLLDVQQPLQRRKGHIVLLAWDCVKGGALLRLDGIDVNKGIKLPPS